MYKWVDLKFMVKFNANCVDMGEGKSVCVWDLIVYSGKQCATCLYMLGKDGG